MDEGCGDDRQGGVLWCSKEEDKKLAILFQSAAADFKGSFILFPVNFLHNCFVNDFYIYENVCFFFLLCKKLSVISFLAGHRHTESLSDPSQCAQPPSGWPP